MHTIHLYHGSDQIFTHPELSDNGQSNQNTNGHDGGFGFYMTTNKKTAQKYGKYLYQADFKADQKLSFDDLTLTAVTLTKLLVTLDLAYQIDFAENYFDITQLSPLQKYRKIAQNLVPELLDENDNDVDLVNGIANANDCCKQVAEILSDLGFNYTTTNNTVIIYDTTHLIDWNIIK